MDTVNINEFFVANLNFTIQDQDAGFGDDGELIGYSEVGGGYFGDDRVEVEHEALCDTTTLSDDFVKVVETRTISVEDEDDTEGMTLSELYVEARQIYKNTKIWVEIDPTKLLWKKISDEAEGRWAHAKDAHFEQRQEALNLYHRLDTKGRPFGEMEALAEGRKERFFKMVHFISICYNTNNLRKMQEEVWKRYINSVKSCVVSKDWWSIYLTSRDAREISDLISAKRQALREGTEDRTKYATRPTRAIRTDNPFFRTTNTVETSTEEAWGTVENQKDYHWYKRLADAEKEEHCIEDSKKLAKRQRAEEVSKELWAGQIEWDDSVNTEQTIEDSAYDVDGLQSMYDDLMVD